MAGLQRQHTYGDENEQGNERPAISRRTLAELSASSDSSDLAAQARLGTPVAASTTRLGCLPFVAEKAM